MAYVLYGINMLQCNLPVNYKPVSQQVRLSLSIEEVSPKVFW